MYKNKLEELLNFLELLRCKSYDEVYLLKKRIGKELFTKLELRYEELKNDDPRVVGNSLEVLEQERTIDFSNLTKNNEYNELCFVLKIMLCSNIEELRGLSIPNNNYYLMKIYEDYLSFFKSEKVHKIPILINIKITSFI